MTVFMSKQKKIEALNQYINNLSAEDYKNYKVTDFEHKKKVARRCMVGALVTTVALGSLIAMTGVIWGFALYKLAAPLIVTGALGTVTAGISAIFTARYRNKLKIQNQILALETGKTKRGRNLNANRIARIDNNLTKAINKGVKKGYISVREEEEYRRSIKLAHMTDEERQDFIDREREEIRTKREETRKNIADAIKSDIEDFANNKLSNYVTTDSVNKISVIVPKYDDKNNILYTGHGEMQVDMIYTNQLNNDIECANALGSIYTELAEKGIDFPVTIYYLTAKTDKDKPVFHNDTYMSKEELVKAKEEYNSRMQTFLSSKEKITEHTL